MTLWIVGRIAPENWTPDKYKKWQLQGVYDSEKRAVDSCLGENWFVGPVILNSPLPTEEQEWAGSYYPKALESGVI